MKDLFNCIKFLGLINGFRYWRIRRAAKKDPALALRWARRCREEAQKAETPYEIMLLFAWARECEAAFEKHKKQITDAKPPTP